jgi:hypothetical protein
MHIFSSIEMTCPAYLYASMLWTMAWMEEFLVSDFEWHNVDFDSCFVFRTIQCLEENHS